MRTPEVHPPPLPLRLADACQTCVLHRSLFDPSPNVVRVQVFVPHIYDWETLVCSLQLVAHRISESPRMKQILMRMMCMSLSKRQQMFSFLIFQLHRVRDPTSKLS